MKFEELQVGAGDDVWGLDENLNVTVGYDSCADQAGLCPLQEWDEREPLPDTERLRLANMMVERWTRYRDAVMAAIIEAGKITSNKIG